MRKNVVPDATSHPFSLATTPCENELFAPDGQMMARKGSHNVKICVESFTFLQSDGMPNTTFACGLSAGL